MKSIKRVAAGLVVGLGLWMSLATPTLAGYGNHAERATTNIQTRVGIATAQITYQLGVLRTNAATKVPTAP
jgi:hypothetical protein